MMKQTLVQKIIKSHCQTEVKVGRIVEITPDIIMAHDGTAPLFIDDFYMLNKKIKNKKKVRIVADHFSPPPNKRWANVSKILFDFVKNENIQKFYKFNGICHQLLVEDQTVVPGTLIIGADSHTVTVGALNCFGTGMGSTDILYSLIKDKIWLKVPSTILITITGKNNEFINGKDIILKLINILGEHGGLDTSLEFKDNTEQGIPIDSRITISNMSVECGATAGIFEFDDILQHFLKTTKNFDKKMGIKSDERVDYFKEYKFDISNLIPQVALPHSPSNSVDVTKIEGKRLDQVFIGSCTNGRLEDIRVASNLLKNHNVKKNLKLIVIPASQKIYLKAMQEGFIKNIIDAGGIICNPCCGPCAGITNGLLGDGERCLSTSNRNFKGRMGSKSAEIYLSSPATAAASAIEGKITDPRRYLC